MTGRSQHGLIKICGLREPEHAVAAAEAGADFIGFVFAPSRRRVTVEQAAGAIESVRRFGGANQPKAVGVFVDEDVEEINALTEAAGLDLVQLHGNRDKDSLKLLNRPYVAAFRTSPGVPATRLLGQIRDELLIEPYPRMVLIDGYHSDLAGGSGAVADWELVREIEIGVPLLLAGGLNALNVATAIQITRPAGVDVSSGVEKDGEKKVDLIEKFIRAARATFAAQTS